MRRSRTVRSGVAVALAAAVLVGGCSGRGGGDSASDAAAGAAIETANPDAREAPQPASGGAAGDNKAGGAKVDAASVDPSALAGRRLVRNGDLSVRVADVPVAVAKVRSLATAARGVIADEKTSTQPVSQPEGDAPSQRPFSESVLTVRVPQTALDKVMDDVGRLGTVVSRGQSSSDVTGQYIDTTSRLRTQRESVERVRALLGRATTIGQVVQIESELARRQADLESLQARMAALEDQTTLATLVVTLMTKDAPVAATVTPGSFVAGLRGGWDALLASVAVALTVIGAVLPFAILIALVAVPLLVLRRRRTRSVPAAS